MPRDFIFYPDPQPTQKIPYVPIPPQGNQPSPVPPLGTVNAILIRQSWEPPDPQPQRLPPFVPIPAPPPTGWVNRSVILTAWVPPDPPPVQKGPIAPLTLVYGQQPPPAPQPNALRQAWEPPWTGAQSASPSAAWNIPPVVVTFVAFGRDALALRSWQPPDPLPAQKALYAPIPAQGQQPPPWSIVNVTAIRQIWEPPWTGPQSAAPAAPLALVYGQQPPRQSWVTLYVTLYAWAPPDPQPARLFPIQVISGAPPPPTGGLIRQFRVEIDRALSFTMAISRLEAGAVTLSRSVTGAAAISRSAAVAAAISRAVSLQVEVT